MITTSNYKSTVDKIGIEKLPSELQEAHNFLNAATSNFTNWKNTSDEFNQVKTLAFEKLQLFLKSNTSLNGKDEPLYIKQAKEDAVAYQWMETDKLKMIYRMELDAELEGDGTPEEIKIRRAALEKELRKRDKAWLKTFKPMNGTPDATKEIRYIEWFLTFHNKRVKRSEFVELLHELQTDIKEKEIRKTSPLAKQILKIQDTVVELLDQDNNAYNITISDSLKSEFSNAIKEYRAAKKKSKDDDKPKSIDLSGVPEKTNVEILSSVEFAKKEFSCLGFTDKWLNFIGDPSPGFTAMVFGKPKMGKSYLCVDFAGYLARHFGKVLYVAKEEKLDATLQKKLKDKDVAHENLFVTDNLPADLSPYNFIILDSVNLLGLSPEDLRKLKANNPGKGFIYVFQTTKAGNFRGANSFQHDVDIVIEVAEKGKAIQFGRFNQGGEMTIFEDAIPRASEELSGVTKKNVYPTWTRPKYMDERDHKQLRHIYDLYKKGKFKEAYNYASFDCDTAIREEIPGEIWKKIGGELTPSGEAKLKAKLKAKKGKSTPVKEEKKKRMIVFNSAIRFLKNYIQSEWNLELNDSEYIEILDIAQEKNENLVDLIDDLGKNIDEFTTVMVKAMKEWDQDKGNLEERNKGKFNPAHYEDRKDDDNPSFIFSLTSTKLLTEALKGDFDIIYLVRKELTNRGLDQNGQWVGFDRAKEIHRIE
jgi:hypothetical protein